MAVVYFKELCLGYVPNVGDEINFDALHFYLDRIKAVAAAGAKLAEYGLVLDEELIVRDAKSGAAAPLSSPPSNSTQ